MELRAKMKSHQMTEAVNFWRWVSPNTIAIVTPGSVYHWSIEGACESHPTNVFSGATSNDSFTF
jgi:clathrin heavy chain